MIAALVGCVVGAFVLAVVAVVMRRSRIAALVEAPAGAERVEKLRALSVKDTVDLYARHGWEIIERSPSPPRAINPEVTITFRKS